jgi:hypothetical protein
MSTRRIPPESWPAFLDSFTRQHHGWLVTIDSDSGRIAEEEPLDVARADGRTIEVRAGSAHYRVPNAGVVTVTAADADDSAIERVEIESGSEKVTLRFRAVINPELVDGVAP